MNLSNFSKGLLWLVLCPASNTFGASINALAATDSLEAPGGHTTVVLKSESNGNGNDNENLDEPWGSTRNLLPRDGYEDETFIRDDQASIGRAGTTDVCEKRRAEIADSIDLINDISTTGDVLGFLLPFVTPGSATSRVVDVSYAAMSKGASAKLEFGDNLNTIRDYLAERDCELLKLDEKKVTKQTKKHFRKIGDILYRKKFKKVYPKLIKKKDIPTPPYDEIDLCQETCLDICRLDFIEIQWLTDDTSVGELVKMEKRLIRSTMDKYIWNPDGYSPFAKKFRQTILESIFEGFMMGKKRTEDRRNALITFAENLNSYCGGICGTKQLTQENNGCCTYNYCDGSNEYYIRPSPNYLCSGFAVQVDVYINYGDRDNTCYIDSTDRQFEQHSWCFGSFEEFQCVMDRKLIGEDRASYCGATYNSDPYRGWVMVGARPVWDSGACGAEGPQSSWSRIGQSFCNSYNTYAFTITDMELVERCPGRFAGYFDTPAAKSLALEENESKLTKDGNGAVGESIGSSPGSV